MIINGIELEDINILDVDVAEKYEKALDKVRRLDIAELKKKKLSENIRIQCEAVFNFFNEVFGDGTDKKVFGNKTNLMVCLKSFADVAETLNQQIEEASQEANAITNKYSPNRAQRRAKK